MCLKSQQNQMLKSLLSKAQAKDIQKATWYTQLESLITY